MERTHVNTASAMPPGSVARTEESQEPRGREVRPGVAGGEHGRGPGRELGSDQPRVVPVAGQVEGEFPDARLVPDEGDGGDAGRRSTDGVEELFDVTAVEVAVVLDRGFPREFGGHPRPGVLGAARGG